MADQPKKVGVYETGGTTATGGTAAGATTAGTTTAGATDTGPRPHVEVHRDTAKSGRSWWVIALIVLAIIIAFVLLT